MYRREVRRVVYPTKCTVPNVEVAKAHAATRFRPLRPHMRDGSYVGVLMEAWRTIIAYDLTDVKGYSRDVFDCDDFAMIFKAHCIKWFGVTGIGLVVDYSARYAHNALLVCGDGKTPRMIMFEPQTDRIFGTPDGMHRGASGYLHIYLFIYRDDSFEDVLLFYKYHYTDGASTLQRYDNELRLCVTTYRRVVLPHHFSGRVS